MHLASAEVPPVLDRLSFKYFLKGFEITTQRSQMSSEEADLEKKQLNDIKEEEEGKVKEVVAQEEEIKDDREPNIKTPIPVFLIIGFDWLFVFVGTLGSIANGR